MADSRIRRAFPAIALLAALVAAAFLIRLAVPRQELYQHTFAAMGTIVEVAAWHYDNASAAAAIDAAAGTISRLESLLSRFDPQSDVSRINAAAPGSSVEVAPETAAVLALSADVAHRTGGAFDITVGPLVLLWKDADKSGVLPSADAVASALAAVGYRNVALDGRAVRVLRPGVSLDLSAVAKGYVSQRAAEALKVHGVLAGFVNSGGDGAFIGSNPGYLAWRVGVADPRDASLVYATLYVRDKAVVTSGNYMQFSVIGGKRYSHIIDPRTGWALEGPVAPASVTVVAADAAVADAWATGLSVLGRDGLAPAREAGVDFLMLFIGDDGALAEFATPGFQRYRNP